MNRAQFLQARHDMQLVATLVRTMPLEDAAATIRQAIAEGPVQSPKMWVEGAASLERDAALVQALIAFRNALGEER